MGIKLSVAGGDKIDLGMEIQFAKEFICQDLMKDIIYITKSFEKVEELLSQDKYLSVWGVFDTKNGLILFEIVQGYDGEYRVWGIKYAHKDSFMKFNNNCKIVEC